MTLLYPNLCYNGECYKETALYLNRLAVYKMEMGQNMTA